MTFRGQPSDTWLCCVPVGPHVGQSPARGSVSQPLTQASSLTATALSCVRAELEPPGVPQWVPSSHRHCRPGDCRLLVVMEREPPWDHRAPLPSVKIGAPGQGQGCSLRPAPGHAAALAVPGGSRSLWLEHGHVLSCSELPWRPRAGQGLRRPPSACRASPRVPCGAHVPSSGGPGRPPCARPASRAGASPGTRRQDGRAPGDRPALRADWLFHAQLSPCKLIDTSGGRLPTDARFLSLLKRALLAPNSLVKAENSTHHIYTIKKSILPGF